MIIKTIPSTWIIDEEHRLDCGPFVKGGVEARKIIEALPCQKNSLVDLTKNGISGMYHVGQDKIIWAGDLHHGMPFLRSGDILKLDFSGQSLISRKQVAENSLFQCPYGSTLITRSGTIGKMIYMRVDMADTAISQDVLKVVPDSDLVQSGYLFAFLRSKFGLPIIVGGTFGSVIVHIEAENIAGLPVPRLGGVEDEAHIFVEQAASELTESINLMERATKSLLENAGLKESINSEFLSDNRRLGWTESVSNLFSLRSLNFDPRSIELVDSVRSIRHDLLGDLVDRSNFEGHIVFKRIDASPEYGVMLVGQREAFQIRPEGRWISKKSIEGLGLQVPAGTTVIPCHGTLGEAELYCRATLVTERSSQYAYSGDFYRCIPKEGAIAAGYLFAFLRSRFAFRMIRAMSTGSKQQYQHPVLMANMPIPRLDLEKEQEIASMVDQAAYLRDHALDLEDQAIALVERAIEEGGR